MKKYLMHFLVSILIFLLFVLASCEIGLGPAVDTQAPTLSIDYPPDSAIIRDTFVLSGICSDDMGVDSVKVTINNTDIGVVYGPFDATIKDNRWSIILNEKGTYNGFAFPDGRYTADVYAIDGVKRESGVSSTSFDIDNTAPVLYLSKPLTVGSDAEFSTFGRQIKIAGDISEDHLTENFQLHFKEYNTSTKTFGNQSDVNVKNVTDMSSDTPLVIARYYSLSEIADDSSKKELRDNYLKIYGSDADNTDTLDKVMYCTIELYDNARVFKTPGDTGIGEGNKSTRYFINNKDFVNQLVSDNTYGLTPDKMKKFINGTLSVTDTQKKEISSILEKSPSFYVNSEEITLNSSKFVINPENSPVFYVDDYDVDLEDTKNWNNLISDSSITININAGKDSVYVKPNTVKISVTSKDAENPLEIIFVDFNDAEKIWTDTDDLVLKKTINISKTDNYIVGKQYVINVSGKDRDDNEIIPKNNKGYGFTLESSSTPPKVNINENFKDKYYSAAQIKNGIEILFSVETDSVNLLKEGENLADCIYVVKDANKNGQSIFDRSTITEYSQCVSKYNSKIDTAVVNFVKPDTYTESAYVYQMKMKVGGDESSVMYQNTGSSENTGIFKYNFNILAMDANDKAGTDSITFYVDNEKPGITGQTISILENSVKQLSKTGDTSNTFVNGKVYVKAKAHDNYEIKSIKYWVYAYDSGEDNGELVYGGPNGISLGKSEDISIIIDTKDSRFDNKIVNVVFEIEDTVGNIGEYNTKDVFANVIVDQNTDIPVIDTSNFEINKNKNDINSSINMFDKSSKLIGKIEDDDGLGNETSFIISKNGSPVKTYGITGDNKIENAKSFSFPLPEAAGFYEIKIKAKDNTGISAADVTTVIAIDNEAPVLEETIIGTENVLYKDSGSIKFKCSITDDFTESDIYPTLSLKVNDEEKTSEIIKEGNFYNYSFDFTPDEITEGIYKFEFVATDISGKTSTVTRTVCKDKTKPEFRTEEDKKPRIITEGKFIDGNTWYTVQTLQIKGEASDKDSGVKEVQYSTDGGKNWLTFFGATSFEGVLTGLSHGSVITIKVIDNAGNESVPLQLGQINIDNVRPTMDKSDYTIDNPEDDKAIWKKINGILILNGENDVSLRGTTNDVEVEGVGLSGVEKINLKCGNSDFSSADTIITTFTDIENEVTKKQWVGTIKKDALKRAFDATGSGEIWAQVVDKAGMTYELPLLNVKYDSKYPEAKITSIKYYGTESNVTDANKTIVINGTAKDNQSLNRLKLEYTLYPVSDTSKWTQYGEPKIKDLYTWSFDVDTTALDSENNPLFNDNSSYVFRAVAQDDAGNEGNSFNDRTSVTSNEAFKTSDGYYKKITINQDSDRPVIKISNLDFGTGKNIQTMKPELDYHAHLYNLNTIYLTVSDDDGDVKTEYKLGNEWKNSNTSYYTQKSTPVKDDTLFIDSGCVTEAKNSSGDILRVGKYIPVSNTSAAYITLKNDEESRYLLTENWEEISGDSFTIQDDGPHTVIFKITDSQNTVFVTDESLDGKPVGPKLQNLQGKEPDSKDTRLFIDVDMNGPNEDESKRRFSSYYSKSDEVDKYGEWKDNQSEVKFGGDYTKLKISFSVQDANGVERVTLNGKEASCKDIDHRDGNYHIWEIKDIDITGVNGKNQFTLVLSDYAGNKDETNIYIDIDNTPASIGFDSHTEGEQVGTAFILKGYLTDNDDETTVKFYTDSNSANPETNNEKWASAKTINYVSSIWRINVDGATGADDGETHTESHKKLFVDAYGESEKIKLNDENLVVYSTEVNGHHENEKFLDPKPLYFHFLVTDRVGNRKVITFNLNIDPQGDIPTIETTYPVYPKGDTTEPDVLTGKIRVQGKAVTKGNNNIVGVYIQIDPNVTSVGTFGASKWTGPDISTVKDALEVKLKDKTGKNDAEIEYIYERYNKQPDVIAKNLTKEKNNKNDMYAIWVGNNASWNYTINAGSELEIGETNCVGIRMYVVDTAGNINILKKDNDVFIKIDAQAPRIGSEEQLYLYQYAWEQNGITYYTNTGTPTESTKLYTDSGCNTEAEENWQESMTQKFASMKYVDDMFVKGEWWLSGSISDESGIKLIKDTQNNYTIYPEDNTDNSKSSYFEITEEMIKDKEKYGAWSNRTGYIFNYRIGKPISDKTSGNLKYKLFVEEDKVEGARNSELLVSINYDNEAPKLLPNESDFNTNIVNEYGFYTFSSSASETGSSQSGFARAVVYFIRTSNNKIFDTYLKKTSDKNALDYANLHYEDKLYWIEKTISSVNGSVVDIDSSDNNIHKGGFVKVAGSYYTINQVTGNKITLDEEISDSLNGRKIFFAIGNVIDTVGAESTGTKLYDTEEGYGYYSDSLDNNDDYMIESTITTGGITRWTGSINSNNIPDGPIDIHYVVFDKAGNFVEKTITDANVKNNAPRLASVRVWCDFNDDGKEQTDESKGFYYNGKQRYIDGKVQEKATGTTDNLIISGNKKNSENGGTAFMTVKNKVTFFPEIIGGNGELYYQYKFGKAEEYTNRDVSFGTGHDDNLDEVADDDGYLRKDMYGDSYVQGSTGDGTSVYKIEVTTDDLNKLGNSKVNQPTWFRYKIWDSTQGTTKFTDSLNASFEVALDIQYADTTPPVVNVKPFFYQNEDNNSLYQNNGNNGHIELTPPAREDLSALKTKIGTSFTADLDSLADSDPKVSGKITIRGTAYDDISLKTLTVRFDSHSKLNTDKLAATYNKTKNDGKWTSESEDIDTNMSTNGWTFTATDRYNDERGHLVDWECSIDTAFVTNKAELDRTFIITAKDERGNTDGLQSSSSDSLTDESVNMFNRPSYRMDVVPYITKVTTALSNTDPSNPTVYSRSALGHYPVSHTTAGFTDGNASWKKEKVTLEGFNFDYDTDKTNKEVTPENTGNFEITQNGIPTLNNYNSNTVESNYQHNGVNNDTLTDDVYFDVWQFNSKAGIPLSGKADNLQMKINPTNNALGFAFSNSSSYFSMPDSKENSVYSYNNWVWDWDYMRWNALAYDKTGNAYACTVGGDTNSDTFKSSPSYSDVFMFEVSRWTRPATVNRNTKGRIIETIAQKGKKGETGVDTPYVNKNRFQSQSIATYDDGTKTSVYLAYYDATNNEIRINMGEIAHNANEADYGTLGGRNTTPSNYNTSAEKCNIIVDGIAGLKDSQDNYLSAGQYVSIGVTKDNRVVMTWYDGNDLWYTYTTKKDASNTIPTTGELVAKKGINTDYWAAATKIMENAGKDCQLVVDSDNGVHVAAYDILNSSLNYVFIKTATEPGTRINAFVDSYLDVGEKLTIDVAKNGKYQIPYIGYWGGFNQKPRYAYLAKPEQFYKPTGAEVNGVNISTDKYTGVWECTTVPVVSSPNKNKINVGVWKSEIQNNCSGTLAYSTEKGTPEGTNNYTSSTATTENGICYGNGTNNGVLAYTISISGSERYIETAQLK